MKELNKSARLAKSYKNFAILNIIFSAITFIMFSGILILKILPGLNESENLRANIISATYFLSLALIFGIAWSAFMFFRLLEIKGQPSHLGPVLVIIFLLVLTGTIKLMKNWFPGIGDVDIILFFQVLYGLKYAFLRKYKE